MDHRLPPELEGDDDVVLSYLPLAHIYERVLEAGAVRHVHYSLCITMIRHTCL